MAEATRRQWISDRSDQKVPRAYSMFCASTVFFLILACVPKVSVVQATDHFCANGHWNRNLKLSHDSDQSENFIPAMEPHTVCKCTWKVELPRDMMLILQGFDAAARFNRRQKRSVQSQWISYNLTESSTGYSREVPNGVINRKNEFRVVPLTNVSTLTVTYERHANYSGNIPLGLTIQLLHEGFCSREVVSFNKRCYKKSEINRTMTDELRFINRNSQIVQLASFNSIAAIRQFIEISKRKFVGPVGQQRSKVPLNLRRPARIGLFYDRQSKRISYLFRNASGDQCQLEEFKDNINFTVLSNHTLTCGSLRVDKQSGMEVLEFRNCDESLPALISFADTPTVNYGNCSKPVDIWLQGLQKTDAGEGYSNWIDYRFLIAGLAAGATALLFVAAIGMLFTRYRYSRRSGVQQRCSKKPLESTKNDCENGYSAKQPLNEEC